MSNLQQQYQLTQKIHQLLPQINQKYGLEIKVGAKFYIDLEKENRNLKALIRRCEEDPTIENALYVEQQRLRIKNWKLDPDFTQEIQSPQLRQILVGLKDVLGDNPEFNHTTDFYYYNHSEDVYELGFQEGQVKVKQAEALCQKWLDGLNPLFDREPETVLTELVEILENLLK